MAKPQVGQGGGFILPVSNVLRLAHVQWTAAVHQRFDHVVIASRHDELLVQGRRAGLLACHETGADPHPRGAIGKCGGEATSVGDAPGRDDDNGLSGQRASLVLAKVDHGGNEDGEGRVTGVSAAFAALGAYNVNACTKPFNERMIQKGELLTLIQCLLHMLQQLLGKNDEEAEPSWTAPLDVLSC